MAHQHGAFSYLLAQKRTSEKPSSLYTYSNRISPDPGNIEGEVSRGMGGICLNGSNIGCKCSRGCA